MRKSTTASLLVGVGAAAIAAARLLRNTTELDGKSVLITGSSRGLGLALAEEYGRRGARLILTARDPNELQRARTYLLSRGAVSSEDAVALIPCDVTSSDQTAEMIALASSRFDRIDVLVNNAGIITVGPVEDQPLSAFEDAMRTNYFGMVHATLAVLPQMLARGAGSIVNITSIGGKVAVPHLLPYAASKFATVGFSEGLRAELRGKGIRVTTVCPGLMRTGSFREALFTGDREREYRWFSLGASLPGASTSAAHAARRIVRATELGTAEIFITPQAWIAGRLGQAMPNTTAAVLKMVNDYVLPNPVNGNREPEHGRHTRGKELSSLLPLGRRAAKRYNQEA